MTTLLEVQSVGSQEAYDHILKEVTFSLNRGETLAVVGPNGSGKTTLLRIIAGLRRPSEGRVTIDGADVNSTSREALSRLVSLVPQRVEHLPPFTVREFIELSGTKGGAEGALLIQSLGSKQLPHLSGGELQRVMIAGALAQGAQLILLDEPSANLDPSGQRCIESALVNCRSSGELSYVVVTHDITLAAAIADRVIILRNGMIFWSGRTTERPFLEKLSDVYGCPFLDLTSASGARRIIVPG